jgi:putative tricarboxylic transport membrane protein
MIIMMATIGAFATKNIAVDVVTMAIAGLVGFVFVTCKFNVSAMILGLVLGKICESNLRRAFTIADGETLLETTWNVFKAPLKIAPVPLTAILMIICAVVLVSPGIKKLWNKKKAVNA